MTQSNWWSRLFSPADSARPPEPEPIHRNALLSVRVASSEAVAEGIRAFELVLEDGDRLPPFTAGAHIDVELPDLSRRQYSLYNAQTDDRCYRIAVLRDPKSRGGSRFMHDHVQPGDWLRISPPRNHFGLVAGQSRARLIAGGIGITPILSMAQALHAQKTPFVLTYAARDRQRMAFADFLHDAPFAQNCRLHLDDEIGRPLDLVSLLSQPALGEHLYVCGPAGLIKTCLYVAKRLGWPDTACHREHFSNTLTPSIDRPFRITLKRSGRTILVPAGKSALKALIEAGVDVPSSCEEGTCGTCVTRVLAGDAEHRDVYLTDAERKTHFTPCCSRARSDELVVDL